jgi:hypothetical protein
MSSTESAGCEAHTADLPITTAAETIITSVYCPSVYLSVTITVVTVPIQKHNNTRINENVPRILSD